MNEIYIVVTIVIQCSLYIRDTLVQESLSVTQRCPLHGGYLLNGDVRYRKCPLREAIL